MVAQLAHPSHRTSDLPFETSDILSTGGRLSQVELDFQLGLVTPLPLQDACEDKIGQWAQQYPMA